MPLQALDGMTVLASSTGGLMAYTLQPNGMIDMTFGTMPVAISYDDFLEPGGPITRLRMSTACSAAYGQKEMGALLATREERTWSMII